MSLKYDPSSEPLHVSHGHLLAGVEFAGGEDGGDVVPRCGAVHTSEREGARERERAKERKRERQRE